MAQEPFDQGQVPQEDIERQDLLRLDIPDEELVRRIDSSIRDGRKLYTEYKKRAELLEKYWKGQQIDAKKLHDYAAKAVDNAIFRNLETMIPIITSNTPDPAVIHGNKTYARKIKQLLTHRWEVVDKMLNKNRLVLRHHFLWFLGVLKYRYDDELGDIAWDWVLTENVGVDDKATGVWDCRYVAEYIKDLTAKEITERFPDKKEDFLRELGAPSEEGDENRQKILGGKVTFVEFNTPEWTAWKYKDVILDKQKNPNWDWGENEVVDEMGAESTQAYNILDKPVVPYLFLASLQLGRTPYSDTSVVEQVVSLQDLMNKRKRQISDNADKAQGTMIGSGDGISKENLAKLTGDPDEKIWISGGDVRKVIGHIEGRPLQPYVFDDMLHTERSIDNNMGTHQPTRGEGGQAGTATEKVMQKQSDYTRLDDVVRSYEDFNEDYFRVNLQMMLIHFDEEHRYPMEDDDDLAVSRDEIIVEFSKSVVAEDDEVMGQREELTEGKFVPPTILVKRGSTLPLDEVTQRGEAIELWARGGIDPITLYRKLKWTEPQEAAKRLFLWQNMPQALFPELQAAGGSAMPQSVVDDIEAAKTGQIPPPNPEVSNPQTAAAHIEGHNQHLDTSDFQSMAPEQQAALVEHVKGELETAKGVLQGAGQGGM